MAESLRAVIRTPHELVFDGPVVGARLPTESGLVGLRPGGEPLVLAVEAGLLLLHLGDGDRFAATAGGLLESTRDSLTIYTPFAALSSSEQDMQRALEQLFSTPPAELVARQRLAELEQRIVRELAQRPIVGQGGERG